MADGSQSFFIDYVGGTNKTVFGYDGFNHRITTAETVSGTTTTTRNLWCGGRICQTRTSGDVVIARYHPEGEYIVAGTKKYVYMPDQLGSVRDVIDATTGTAVAAMDYGPYGKPIRTWGTATPLYQYAGLMYHPNSGLNLATYRALDGATGRWLNRDPIRERGGVNLYGYVGASVIGFYDSEGLSIVPAEGQSGEKIAIAIGDIARESGMEQIIINLRDSSAVFTVKQITGEDNYFDPVTNTIYWNPDRAHAFENPGGCDSRTQSPALALAHEFSHAESRIIRPILNYFNSELEEGRVIGGPESAVAKKLGEYQRRNHSYWYSYPVKSPDER